jgi:hypothetical protein
MLRNTRELKGFSVQAWDGEIGVVDALYFDDQTWTIRYLSVYTGNWLSGHQVLISPISVTHIDSAAKLIHVVLTREQVEHSPDINMHLPVSRQHEAATLGYYGYARYWMGPYLWGPSCYPDSLALETNDASSTAISQQEEDAHLRSTEAVIGYDIDAEDGEIGHVVGFVMEDESWSLRYIEVATRNWWPGKKILVSPAWVERVSWADSKVHVALMTEVIKTAPEYAESLAVTREYESQIYFHYGRPPYSPNEVAHLSSLSLRDV